MATNINADTSGGLKLTSDTSGQLELQSAGSTKVTVTSGGNVGIGTTSPSSLMELSSDGPAVLTITADTDNVTETDNASIKLQQDGGVVVGRVGYQSGTNTLEVWNEYNEALSFGLNTTEHMNINNNGYVTKPNQCYFRVVTDNNTNAQTGTIPWTLEVADIGNNFASNQFTAPVDGNYFFAHNNLAGNNGNVNNDVSLYVNGVATSGTRVREDSGTSNWVSYNIVAIIYLNANDVVDVRVIAGQVYCNSTTWTSFYGYLLG